MPKLPMDYSKCCIYKIEHIDDESLVYVGHTTNFDKRKTAHKSTCYNGKAKNYNLKVYQMIRENGGWDNFRMIEVEKYSCNDKREAERRENETMKQLKASLNMIKSFRTEEGKKLYMEEYNKEHRESNKEKMNEYKKEYYEENKEKLQEKMKDYREENKEKIQEYKKIYIEANKEKIQEKRKDYYELNKAKINAKVKDYYEANKEKMKEHKKEYYEENKDGIAKKRKININCLCGCVVIKPMLKRHQTSKKIS